MAGNAQRQGKLKDILNVGPPAGIQAAGARKPRLDDATIDIGALMQRALQAPKLRGAGDTPSGPSRTASVLHNDQGRKPAPDAGGGMEFRGNPIYSPDDSLAQAASKLASLKAAGDARRAGAATSTAAAAGQAGSKQDAGEQEATPPLPEPQPSESPAAHPGRDHPARKPRPSEGATPGWQPTGRAAATKEIPLAAHTVITKRNRRKSVYQRPARYGDWWSGNDDELDRMVSDYNEDEAEEAATAAAAEDERKRIERRDKAARRKSSFPALARTQSAGVGAPIVATSPLPPPAGGAGGDALGDQVRAIAGGLCEQLDGLIEESPEKGRQRYPGGPGRSLRDKLLESWEGKSYYDRLMELAGDREESEGDQDQAAAGKSQQQLQVEALLQPQAGAARDLLAKLPPTVREECTPAVPAAGPKAQLAESVSPKKVEAPPAKEGPAPPRPAAMKPAPPALKVEVPLMGIDLPPRPLSTTAARQMKQAEKPGEPLDSSRLLKVSGRGARPMPAPWQSSDSPTQPAAPPAAKTVDLKPASSPRQIKDVAAAVPLLQGGMEGAGELQAAQKALAAALADKAGLEEELTAARAEANAQRQVAAELRVQLEQIAAVRKEEVAAREAAQNELQEREAELQALAAKAAQADVHAKSLHKVAEKAAEVEGRFGLAEVQAEALMVAATALLQHVAEGKAQALEVVELARVEEEAGGQAPARKARGRRKSTWR